MWQLAYPIPPNKQLYDNLLAQCMDLSIPMCRPDVFEVWALLKGTGIVEIRDVCVVQGSRLQEMYDLVVDAIFGFSFRGQQPRPPFDSIIAVQLPSSVVYARRKNCPA